MVEAVGLQQGQGVTELRFVVAGAGVDVAEVGAVEVIIGLRRGQLERQHAQRDLQRAGGLAVREQARRAAVEAGRGRFGDVEVENELLVVPRLGQRQRLEDGGIPEGIVGVVEGALVGLVAADVHIGVALLEVHQQLVCLPELVHAHDPVVVQQQTRHQEALALVGMIGHPGAAAAVPALDERDIDRGRREDVRPALQVGDLDAERLHGAEGHDDDGGVGMLSPGREDADLARETAAPRQVAGHDALLRRGRHRVAGDRLIRQRGVGRGQGGGQRARVAEIPFEAFEPRACGARVRLHRAGARAELGGPAPQVGVGGGPGDRVRAGPQRVERSGFGAAGDQLLRLERGVVEHEVAERAPRAAREAEGRPGQRLGQEGVAVLHLPAAVQVERVAAPVPGVVEGHVVPGTLADRGGAPHDEGRGHDRGGPGAQGDLDMPGGHPRAGEGAEVDDRVFPPGWTVEADFEGAGDLVAAGAGQAVGERGRGIVGQEFPAGFQQQRAPADLRPGAQAQRRAAGRAVRHAPLRGHREIVVQQRHRIGGEERRGKQEADQTRDGHISFLVSRGNRAAWAWRHQAWNVPTGRAGSAGRRRASPRRRVGCCARRERMS